MQTLYRRLLQLMPRFGVRVTDLAPGTALVSRRGRYTVKPAGKDAWLVSRDRASGGWTSVPLGESGARLVLGETSAADERKLQMAAAEYLGTQHVGAMLDLYGVNCVLDVGANRGQYAKRLRKHGYRGRIVSFEPTEDAFAKLSEAAARDPKWQVHHCGLGREDTTAEIHVGWNTMNSLLPASDYGRDRYKRFHTTRTEEIRVRRLDAVLDEALDGIEDPRPFLKMDTQGYDLEVFAGAGERIADFVGLQSEVAVLRLYEGSPPMSEAVAAYEDGGFEITGMYPVTREAATGRVVEFDIVMMRPKAVQ
ncbi:FkbM family methyltransferase [Streptomyces cinnabarinus]|uniref:FkbM family methyltransferase n=1 Tax=Streptomyces cinnabarinus TaxID=67287 RepID=A0ABY7KME1_9ACTN|nr:FkbM family methyltransferase [Streptomyces cinnabarinus]WAZ25727.1 FkbM family methyltransferase [Streptomyces cinnabarinus]